VPLSELHGAFAARALDQAGVETVLGARVQEVSEQTDGRLEVVADERSYRADAVVVDDATRSDATAPARGVLRPS